MLNSHHINLYNLTVTSVSIFSIKFLYISCSADKENAFNNLLLFVIISFILVSLMCGSGMKKKIDANYYLG